jgi:hypothetical protein
MGIVELYRRYARDGKQYPYAQRVLYATEICCHKSASTGSVRVNHSLRKVFLLMV